MRNPLAAALAAAAALALPPGAQARERFSFLVTQTDQMAVPGHAAGTEITPEGFLYTGYTELVYRYGRDLERWDEAIRVLYRGRYPIFKSKAMRGGVVYDVRAFAEEVGGRPVNFLRVRMRNRDERTRTARFAVGVRHSGGRMKDSGVRRFRFLRPASPERPGLYFQPGYALDRDAEYDYRGRAVTRDGMVLYVFPREEDGARRRRDLRPRASSPADGVVLARTEFGRTDYSKRLRPGRSLVLDFVMPVVPVQHGTPEYREIARASYARARGRLIRRWRRIYDRALGVDVPEQKVEDAFYASLMNVLMARYRDGGDWIQAVNKLQYHSFFLRDAAVMTNALDLAGLHGEARENLAFFLRWQRPDGLFISRPGQHDGFGQALWALGEHARRTGDAGWARGVLPAVERAIDWFERARRDDPLGLVPPSDPGDNELTKGHLAGDNFWAAAGVARAIELARIAGRADLAERWTAILGDFRRSLDAAVRRAARRTGGWIPPALDTDGGQDWGNLWAAYPVEVYGAHDPLVRATVRHVRDEFEEGIATYDDGRLLHSYLGFRVFQTELLQDDQDDVVLGLYDSLAHTTASHGGFETGIPAWGSRSVDDNMSPHGWFAAEYVTLLRNMLVREDSRGIVLMSALSPHWLEPGEEVAVGGAETVYGRVWFRLRAERGGATLRWSTSAPEGTSIRWPVPDWVRRVRAPGLSEDGDTIVLHGRRGEIEVRWRRTSGDTSYRERVRRLVRAYERREDR